MVTPLANVKTKKKSRAMQPVVIRMPSALVRLLKRDARAAGVDLSTYVRDVLASVGRSAYKAEP